MKWVGRLLSLLAACLFPPLLIPLGGILLGWSTRLGTFYFPMVTAGLVAAVLVAVPGLLIFDRVRVQGAWPRIALGAGVGLVAGVFCWMILLALYMDFGERGFAILSLFSLFPPAGIALGLLGTWVFWVCNREFTKSAARTAANDRDSG